MSEDASTGPFVDWADACELPDEQECGCTWESTDPNGRYFFEHTADGGKATFRCDPGYMAYQGDNPVGTDFVVEECDYDYSSDVCYQPQPFNYECRPVFCTNFPDFPGFRIKWTDYEYYRVGDTLHLECDIGTCGSAKSICRLDSNLRTASWSFVHEGVCSPASCRSQPPLYGVITDELIDHNQFFRVTCNPGYYAYDNINQVNLGLSADVKCVADNGVSWSLSNPSCEHAFDHHITCEPVVCPPLPDIPGFITPALNDRGTDVHYLNLEATYYCGDETCGAAKSTCLMDSDGATASWSYLNSAICRPKSCAVPFDNLPNGVFETPVNGLNPIQFRCNPGYLAYFRGENTGSAKHYITCDTDENNPECIQEIRYPVECRPVVCGAPTKVLGFADPIYDATTVFSVGTEIDYTCDVHSCGLVTSRCQLNSDGISASWTRIDADICVPKSCYVTEQAFGSASIDYMTDGSSAVQTCIDGYHTRRYHNSYERHERYFCNTAESLDLCNDAKGNCCQVEIPSVPCSIDTCEQRCEIDIPDNAQVYAADFADNTEMQIHCNAGYVMYDSGVNTLSRTATLSCVIGATSNCRVNIPHNFSCRPVKCGNPLNFDGFQAYSDSDSVGGDWQVGSWAEYVCDTQHCGKGQSRCNLNADGVSASWTFLSSGYCVPKTCNVAALNNGEGAISNILNNDIVIQACDDGYFFTNSDNVFSSSVSTVCDTSSNNDSCDDPSGACCQVDLPQPAVCEIPPVVDCVKTCSYTPPANGMIYNKNIRDREEFVITCNPGFVVWCDGVNERSSTKRETCLVDQNDPTCNQVMDHRIECRPVECEEPPKFFGFQFVSGTVKFPNGNSNSFINGTLPNGNHAVYQIHGHWCVGDKAEYICTQNKCGKATTKCVLNIDKITGTWTPISNLVCQPKTCRLPKLENGSGLVEKISNGFNTLQTCNQGYRMVGYGIGDNSLARSATTLCDTSVEDHIQCDDVTDRCCVVDLNPQYKCEPIDIEPQCLIQPPAFGSVPSASVDVGSEFVVTCDEGYIAFYDGVSQGSRTYHVQNIQLPNTDNSDIDFYEYDYNQKCDHLVTCQPVRCSDPPVFDGFQNTTSISNTDWPFWTVGETAQYICNQDKCGGAISTCQLNNDGISASWTSITDNLCAEKRCIQTPPANGQISSLIANDGDSYRITCDVGYVAHYNGTTTGAEFIDLTCNTGAVDNTCRSIQNHLVTCECVFCPALPTFPGLTRKTGTDDQIREITVNGQPVIGFVAAYNCPSDSCGCPTTQCVLNEDGITASWTPINDDTCVKKTCAINALVNGEVNTGLDRIEHGHSVTQHCASGFVIEDALVPSGWRNFATQVCDISGNTDQCDSEDEACCTVQLTQPADCEVRP